MKAIVLLSLFLLVSVTDAVNVGPYTVDLNLTGYNVNTYFNGPFDTGENYAGVGYTSYMVGINGKEQNGYVTITNYDTVVEPTGKDSLRIGQEVLMEQRYPMRSLELVERKIDGRDALLSVDRPNMMYVAIYFPDPYTVVSIELEMPWDDAVKVLKTIHIQKSQ